MIHAFSAAAAAGAEIAESVANAESPATKPTPPFRMARRFNLHSMGSIIFLRLRIQLLLLHAFEQLGFCHGWRFRPASQILSEEILGRRVERHVVRRLRESVPFVQE